MKKIFIFLWGEKKKKIHGSLPHLITIFNGSTVVEGQCKGYFNFEFLFDNVVLYEKVLTFYPLRYNRI